jgi:hypothetical protein
MRDVVGPGADPYVKDGRTWRVGTPEDVSLIRDGVTPDLSMAGAIPAVFEAYAAIALCEGVIGDRTPTDPDTAVLDVLRATPIRNRGGSATWRPVQATSSSTRRHASGFTGTGVTWWCSPVLSRRRRGTARTCGTGRCPR